MRSSCNTNKSNINFSPSLKGSSMGATGDSSQESAIGLEPLSMTQHGVNDRLKKECRMLSEITNWEIVLAT